MVTESERSLSSYLWMKLLLSSSVTETARVAVVTIGAVPPLITLFHGRARCASIAMRFWIAPAIFRVVVERTSIALTTHAWRLLARLCLVVGEYIRHV